MNLLLRYLIVLTIGVDNQDTSQVNTNYPDTTCRESKKCIVKQAHINKLAEQISTKLDSINIKYDRRIEEILKILDEDNR